jgi:energy-coupling factor transporter transmembrane protein EcfT
MAKVQFLISTLLFIVSVFVPAPWRFYLCGAEEITIR